MIYFLFFSWLGWGIVLWKEDHTCEVPFLWHHIDGTYSYHNLSLLALTLVILLRLYLSVSPQWSYSCSSTFSHCLLWKGSHCEQPTLLRSRELCFTSLRAEYLCKLLGIFLHGRFVSSPSFISLSSVIFLITMNHVLSKQILTKGQQTLRARH